MAFSYPLTLDVSTGLYVIVGGGKVGARKAAGLLAAGARRVRVVSPTFHENMPAEVERVVSQFQAEHLEGAELVFAATDQPAVNAWVASEARRVGIWVNRADSDDGNFSTPAVLREGAVTICVSAGGNPAIAAVIRDKIKQSLDRRWIALSEAMQRLRPRIQAEKMPEAARHDLFRMLASEEAADSASRGDIAALEARVDSVIASHAK